MRGVVRPVSPPQSSESDTLAVEAFGPILIVFPLGLIVTILLTRGNCVPR